jgi:glycosyltransferase involved in cell wall biosynthesis
VLSVGALTPFKGHSLVIDAVARMKTPRPTLVVIGDRGDDGPALEAQADELGVDLQIRAGIPFGEVVALYQQAAAVVCAQVREPFGLVPLEAMAAGRPVVAVAEGGLRETVQDGVNGLAVGRDPAEVAQALDRLAMDSALRERLSTTGRAAAETEWTWTAYAASIDELLARVARDGRST